ncbi:MAG: alanine racemase, partial [Mesorhizobium sp.]
MDDAAERPIPNTEAAGPVSEAVAGAILSIDLGAIRENYRRLKARAGSAHCAGVVKADGYGLGAEIDAQD